MDEEEFELQLVFKGRAFTIRTALRDPETEIVPEEVPRYARGSLAHVLSERGKQRWFNSVTEDGRDITAEVGRWPLGAKSARKALMNGCDYVINYLLGEPRTEVVVDDLLADQLRRMGIAPGMLEESNT